MDKQTYSNLEEQFTGVCLPFLPSLQKESAENVAHYLDCGELEMAYESFVLSVMEENVTLPDEVRPKLLALGKELGLDKESVFRADFWELAMSFLGAAQRKR